MSGTESIKKLGVSRKVRAILAGGLVLGVGAAITLAAWNDSEFASGEFTASKFNLVGNTDGGTTWSEHTTAAAAAPLAFTLPLATTLSPGDTVYAKWAVQLDATTTGGASVVVSADSTSGVVTNLSYTLVTTAAATCDAAAITAATGSAILVPVTTALGTVPVTPTFTRPAASTPQNMCFAVTAGANIAQGQTGTATWKFAATSTVAKMFGMSRQFSRAPSRVPRFSQMNEIVYSLVHTVSHCLGRTLFIACGTKVLQVRYLSR